MTRLGVEQRTKKLLEYGAELIADGEIAYVQIKTDKDETVKITKRSSGIFLRKTKTNTEELLSEGMY